QAFIPAASTRTLYLPMASGGGAEYPSLLASELMTRPVARCVILSLAPGIIAAVEAFNVSLIVPPPALHFAPALWVMKSAAIISGRDFAANAPILFFIFR